MRRLLVILALLLFLLAACTPPFETDAPMTGFSFSHSGMHTGLIYTLSALRGEDGWRAELSLLCGQREYTLAMTEEEAAGLSALAAEYRLQGWAGFDKVDSSCLDGTGFTLQIDYADGKRLYAHGSNAFPENYRAAHAAIVAYFNDLMMKNGIDSPL